MKKIIYTFVFLGFSSLASAQSYEIPAYEPGTYTTQSKSCGACFQPVSIHSRIGMRCPHCHVRWGKENTKFGSGKSSKKRRSSRKRK